MKIVLGAGILSICLLAGTPARAAGNLDLERLAICQDSWLDWKTGDPARLNAFVARFRSDFSQQGNDAFFVPRSTQTVIGLPLVQAFPQSVGMGVGFSLLVNADFARTKAALERRTGKPLKCEPPSDNMRACELELAEKKTLMLMAEDNPKSTTTLFGCYYFYEK